jgi:predicted dehydrogenase
MNENKKVNVAQIGVGYWGPNLLRNLISNKSCNVKTVVDLSNERREYVKSVYPAVNVSDNIKDVLTDSTIDAIVIATPVATHFDLAIDALKAGKHILVEKPMAKTPEEVNQISNLANKKGLVAMVGHTFLYNSAVQYLKKLIDSGELGDIRYIYSQRLNLGRIRSDVDALWNFAPHDVSIIQYLLNNTTPISINKSGMDFVQNGIDDVSFLILKYPNNIMAHVHVSWLDPHKVRKITVVGSKKMVVYDDIAENKITIYDKGIDKMAILGENMDFDQVSSYNYTYRSGDVFLPKIDSKEPLAVEINHYIDCIQNGTECLTDANHAENVVRILAAD